MFTVFKYAGKLQSVVIGYRFINNREEVNRSKRRKGRTIIKTVRRISIILTTTTYHSGVQIKLRSLNAAFPC
jgi:hypothetical protein